MRDDGGLSAATLVFTQDIVFEFDPHEQMGWDSGKDLDTKHVGRNYFSGIEGVTLTLKSADDANRAHLRNFGATFGNTRLQNAGFSLNDGQTARLLTGPVVFDNIVFDTTDDKGNVRDEVYVAAQGHSVTFTENFSSTKPLHVIGGTIGKYRRLDGKGFGSTTGVDSQGNVLGWIEEKSGVASTHVEIYGGEFGYVYGGGFNGDVSGDTYVKIALPASSEVNFVYGGGSYVRGASGAPSEGTGATVSGNATVEALSGTFNNVYGGADRASVYGDAHVAFGQEQGEDAVYGSVYGGGNQGTLGAKTYVQGDGTKWRNGNATVTVHNTAVPKSPTSSIYGGGVLDVINGTTELILHGGSNNHWIFAGGNNSTKEDMSANILNKTGEQIAARIVINGGTWNNIYSAVETNLHASGNEAEQKIAGDVSVEFNGGHVNYFSLSSHLTHVEGDSVLTINGGEFGPTAPAICGYQYAREDHHGNVHYGQVDGKRIVNINNENQMKCWQMYAIDQINVNNTAPFIVRGSAQEGALLFCGDVNINAGTLALTGPNTLIDTKDVNGLADGASKAQGNLTLAQGATLALNATAAGSAQAPGSLNAEGSATGTGRLLAVVPSGSDYLDTDMSEGSPREGEAYVRANITDESAAPNTDANMLDLANSNAVAEGLFVEYTQDDSAKDSYAHAWRIAQGEIPIPQPDPPKEPVWIEPAKLIIYMGGEHGYDGTIDKDGNIVGSDTLPTMGYRVSLPAELKDVRPEEIEIVRGDGADTALVWRLVKYGEGDHDVYRIVSGEGDDQRDAMTVFFDEDGNVYTESDFDPAEHLGKTLKARPVIEDTDDGEVRVRYGGEEYPLDVTAGELVVSGVTQSAEYARIGAGGTGDADGAVRAEVPEGTLFTINNGDVQVGDDADVSLLFDDIIDDPAHERTDALRARGDAFFADQGDTGEREYEFKYLDLVDRNNGNVWLKPSAPVSISWPLPAGAQAAVDAGKELGLIHYIGLHRSEDDGSNEAAAQCEVEQVPVMVRDGYAVFEIQTFSPFALVWPKMDGTVDPGEPDEPGIPLTPLEPSTPVDPGEPEDPQNPGIPWTPIGPSTPVDPAPPMVPGEPDEPEDPEEQDKPGIPWIPIEPAVPVDPYTPEEPTDPGNPSGPSESVPPDDQPDEPRDDSNGTSGQLPSTGDTALFIPVLAVALLACSCGALAWARRTNTSR